MGSLSLERGQVLADPERDAQLARDGIVPPFPLLDEDQVERLWRRLAPLVPGTPFFTMHREDDTPRLRREIAEIVSEEVEGLVDGFLVGHRAICGGGVFVKQNHPESYLGLHQDWNFVDEANGISGSFWIPLVDTDETNGAFHAVLGSHLVERTYRGSPLWPYVTQDVQTLLEEDYLTRYDVPAGHALVYDHRVVHGSFANQIAQVRPAVVIGFVPIGEPLVHYHLGPDGKQYLYTVSDDFFLDYRLTEEPSGPEVLDCREIDVPVRLWTVDDVTDHLVPTRVRPVEEVAPSPEVDASLDRGAAPQGPSGARRRAASLWRRVTRRRTRS